MNLLLRVALKMQTASEFQLMNTAHQTIATKVKTIAFVTVMFLLMLGALPTCGQEHGNFNPAGNIGVEATLSSILAPEESVEHRAQTLELPAIQSELDSQQTLDLGTLPCKVCQPQAVKTKGKCSLSEQIVCVSGRDEIWLVSARQSHLSPNDPSRLEVSILRDEIWQESSLESLTSAHAADKSRATVVYCHGNRTDLSFAKSRGLQVYQSTFRNEIDQSTRSPVRFVIFAWKSEQEKPRLRPDYELKSRRATAVGSAFRDFLHQFSDRNMLLSGFSLGAQVILAGLTSCEPESTLLDGRYQVALIAPALDPLFVCQSLRRLPEIDSIQRTEVVANENDFVIKVAQKLSARACKRWLPEFKRFTNVNSINPITLHEISDEISHRHAIDNYFKSETVRCIHREMLNQVYAAGQERGGLVRWAVTELEPSQAVPTSDLDESGFIIDLPPSDTGSEISVMAKPVEVVSGQSSN